MADAKPIVKRTVSPMALLLAALAVAAALAFGLQHAIAVQIGRVLAGAWVSTMGAVMSLIGAMFGAH